MNVFKVSPSPHIRHKDHTRTIMLDVIIAMMPALIWGVHVFGFRVITITLLSVGSAVLSEYLFSVITKRPITIGDLSAVVTGIILAFNLPVSVPLWIPVIGSVFAIIVVKMLFGGLGKNIVNPAVAARVFLFISFPKFMSNFTGYLKDYSPFTFGMPIIKDVDAVTSPTPLALLKEGTVNESGLFDCFIGNIDGCIGEVSVLMIAIGFVYLLLRKTITAHIPFTYLFTVFALTLIFPRGDSEMLTVALTELCSGGVVIGAVFMATDYCTSPVTSLGKVIYGFGCGVLTVFFRYFGSYPEGASFAILIMNTLVYFLDRGTRPVPFGGGKKNAEK